MPEPDKAVKFISKLVQLTQDKKIKWDSESPPSNSEVAFTTKVGDINLRLYRYRERIPNPAYDAYLAARYPNLYSSTITISPSSYMFTDRPTPSETIIDSGIVLEIFDSLGRVTYKFRDRTGLSDLYESVSYSSAKVDELINSVLNVD